MGAKQSAATESRPTTGPTITEQRVPPIPLARSCPPPPSSNSSLYPRDGDQYRQQPRLVALVPQSMSSEMSHPRPRYIEVDLLLAELQRMSPPIPPPHSSTSSSTRDNQRRERRSHHHHHHHHRRLGEGINPSSIPQGSHPRLTFFSQLTSETFKINYVIFYMISLLPQKAVVGTVVMYSRNSESPYAQGVGCMLGE